MLENWQIMRGSVASNGFKLGVPQIIFFENQVVIETFENQVVIDTLSAHTDSNRQELIHPYKTL